VVVAAAVLGEGGRHMMWLVVVVIWTFMVQDSDGTVLFPP
jgi:hypothetical protein